MRHRNRQQPVRCWSTTYTRARARAESFNICVSIFYNIHARARGEGAPSRVRARLLECNSKARTFLSLCYAAHARNHFTSFNVPRANLCAHPLWRLRAYCEQTTADRNTNTCIQEISGSSRDCNPGQAGITSRLQNLNDTTGITWIRLARYQKPRKCGNNRENMIATKREKLRIGKAPRTCPITRFDA